MSSQFDTQVICVDDNGVFSFSTEEITSIYTELVEDKLFEGKLGEVYSFRSASEDNRPKNTVLVGIGGNNQANRMFKIATAFGEAICQVKKMGARSVVAWLDERLTEEETAKAIESMHLSKYRFEKYKSNASGEISVAVSSPHNMKEEAEEAILLAQQTSLARDLVNEPPNVLYPETLAAAAVAQGEKCGFYVEVYDAKYIAEKEMNAFLAVSKGSEKPPYLIVMRYEGGGTERIGLVGKGITFDSGGYDLKSSDGMLHMKSDMGGAAAVIGAISAAARASLKINVVGVIAACENLISGDAYKPDDIIKAMNGTTISIENTDAEGRLTLADAVTYAITEENVDRVIDIATLTGAAIVALGDEITAAITNQQDFYSVVEKAARQATEKVWQLPNDFDTVKNLKSDVADLRNIGGRPAGCITAGQFIGEFAGRTPWVHLDIAGPSFQEKESALGPAGATGCGVRTLYHTLKLLSESKENPSTTEPAFL